MQLRAPNVSVIVPVFNDSAQLRTCLEALRDQTHPSEHLEVIVVDNGSDEDVAGVVSAFPGFRLEREDAVGSYAARNQGIEASKGEILAFTDADCVPDPQWVAAGVAALRADPGLGAVGGPIRMFAPSPERITCFDLHDLVWGMPQRVYIESFGLAATGNLFARRYVFDRVGRFDPEFRSCGDCEWSFRLTAGGHRLGYAPDARVQHPTRGSFRSFVRRRRRIAGGYHRLAPLVARLYPHKGFEVPSTLSHSIGRVRRSFQHPRLAKPIDKARFAFAEAVLYLTTRVETWRLRAGSTPTRR
jgi:glycosyltransferase involved in cell wall biosynthesis